MIKVYHFDHDGADRDTSYNVFAGKVVPEFNKKHYYLAAIVDADDLDDAFRLTNHIDHDWTTNARVSAVVGRHRSSSVGDIFVKDAKVFVCAPVGWTELSEKKAA